VPGRPLPPALRRAGTVVVLVLLGLAGVVAAILFFSSRDQSKITQTGVPGVLLLDQGDKHLRAPRPVKYATTPPASGPHVVKAIRRDGELIDADQLLSALELGNVVIVYPGHGAPPPFLRAVQNTDSGPLDPALLQTGNQVVLARYRGVRRIAAMAWRHWYVATSPQDPRLQAFTDYWLGRPLGH
jgi:hypothetical protein